MKNVEQYEAEENMAKAVKMADIAEIMGVSTVTVSKALSGQKGVSEELRERIKKQDGGFTISGENTPERRLHHRRPCGGQVFWTI